MFQASETERRVARELLIKAGVARDKLPYTPIFDEMYAQFIVRTAQADFWRVIVRVGADGLGKR